MRGNEENDLSGRAAVCPPPEPPEPEPPEPPARSRDEADAYLYYIKPKHAKVALHTERYYV